jgi:hypothetical protein
LIKVYVALLLMMFSHVSLGDGYSVESVKVRQGDNLLWATLDYDDKDWQGYYEQGYDRQNDHNADMPVPAGNYWFRFQLKVNEQLSSEQATQLFFHHIGSSEIYWDGRLIDRNGQVGSDQNSELPGQIDRLLVVPHDLYQPGIHVVAVRVSRHHRALNTSRLSYDFVLGPFGQINTQHSGSALVPLITLGSTLVLAGYFIFIFLLDAKQLALLLFGLTCLGVAGMLLGETYRGLFGYTYDWHIVRLQVILCFAAGVGLSFMWFVYHHFKLVEAKNILLVLSALLVIVVNLPSSYDLRSTLVILLSLFFAWGLSMLALVRQIGGSLLMLAGISLCILSALVDPWSFIDSTFYYIFPLMTLFVLASLAVQNKLNQQQRDEALVHSERLKIELLKKNIQPHFILNSLTTLTSWINIDVATANKMIQALAQEFRLLIQLSANPLVTLAQELQLCHSHLQIMGFRKDQQFTLALEGMDDNLLLPPGILHTLLENALSHNRYKNDQVTFHLQLKTTEQRACLTLLVPLGEKSTVNLATGTGTDYIKARLKEAWQQNWSFDSKAVLDNWRTQIDFPLQRALQVSPPQGLNQDSE